MAVAIKIKNMIRGLVGIKYPKTETEFVPIVQEKTTDDGGIGKLIQALNPHIKTKQDIYSTYGELRSNPLVQSLLSKVVLDILYKGRSEISPLIIIEYPDPSLKEILEKQVDTFKLETHIKESLFDTLLYGEYYLKIDYNNTELDDTYNYNDLIPIYSRGQVNKYLKLSKSTGLVYTSGNTYNLEIGANEVFSLSLALPGHRIKLEVKDKSGSKYYVNIPSPFVNSASIPLLNSTIMMEKLIPLSQLMKIDRGQIVNVSVPPGTPIQQMFDICKRYEMELNSKSKDMSSMTVDDILATFGKYKCIPSAGDRKASMELRDLPAPESIEVTDFEYMNGVLANRLGVPLSYIITTDREDTPRSLLTYLFKIAFIRQSIARSVHAFLSNYMNYRRNIQGNKSLTFDPKKLKVKLPAVPGTQTLDAVDIADATSAVLSNVQRIIQDFVDTLAEAPPSVNKVVLLDILNDKLEPIIGRRVFDSSKADEKVKPGFEALQIEKEINKRLLKAINEKKTEDVGNEPNKSK